MLAEYVAPFWLEIVSTVTARTGVATGAAATCCLHPVPAMVNRLASAAVRMHIGTVMHCMALLLTQGLLKCRLRIPERKQAGLIIMVGVGDRCLLLQHIAHQHRRLRILVIDLAQLLAGGLALRLRDCKQRSALPQLAKGIVYIQQDLRSSLVQLIFALLHHNSFLFHNIFARAP